MRKQKLAASQEPKQELYKLSAAIHIHNNITLLQRRTWNVLLYHAYNRLESEEEHQIRLPELADIVGYDSHDLDYLKESTKAMMNCIVEWDVLGKDGSPEWGATVLLAQAEIKRGVLTYAYSPALRRRLHNPSIYARLDLTLQKKFKSKYGLALWEICTDYLGASREYGETPFIDLDAYRKLMGIKKGGYPQFKEFNRCAVKEPMDEINQVSDFKVTADYKRQQRKVVALKFKMRRIALLPAPANEQGSLFPSLEDMPLTVKELKEAGLSPQDAWEVWQHGFDCVDKNARPEISGDDIDTAFQDYIREKIHLLKRRQTSGKVENSTGFLLEAIKKNYSNPEFTQEQKRAVSAKFRNAQKDREQQIQRLEAQKEKLANDREKALKEQYGAIAAASPHLLDGAFPKVFAQYPYAKKFYNSQLSCLENYQGKIMLQALLNPYLEHHDPEPVGAIKERFAAEIAAIDEHIAALQKLVQAA